MDKGGALKSLLTKLFLSPSTNSGGTGVAKEEGVGPDFNPQPLARRKAGLQTMGFEFVLVCQFGG